MNGPLDFVKRRSRSLLIGAALVIVLIVGLADYLTGFEILFSVFYLVAVALAVWFVGKGSGVLMSILSVIAWLVGDWAAGVHYAAPSVVVWNGVIVLAFYLVVVWLLSSLRSLHRELEERVRQRTAALTQEMAERERLEKEIMEVSERERRRIGRDLHDSLCQHLTGTALAGQVLEEKLAAKSLPETADANKIVRLVEDGITLARNLARGIAPVEMEAEGLRAALHELAANVTKLSKITCVFDCDAQVSINDAATATHLYLIAQEAVGNAMRHGKPRRIDISLAERGGRVRLTVEDDGIGLPEPLQKNRGLGTRIMTHRAAMIGGTFSIEPNPTGGTSVECSLPLPAENLQPPARMLL